VFERCPTHYLHNHPDTHTHTHTHTPNRSLLHCHLSSVAGAVNWCCHALPTSGSRERGGLNSFSGGALRGFGEDAAIQGMRRRRARGRRKPRRNTGSVDNAEHRRRSRFSTYACRSAMLMSSDGRRYVTRENTSVGSQWCGFLKSCFKNIGFMKM